MFETPWCFMDWFSTWFFSLFDYDNDSWVIHHFQFTKKGNKHLKCCVMKASVCLNRIIRSCKCEAIEVDMMPGDQLIWKIICEKITPKTKMDTKNLHWVVVWNIFYFHPDPWGDDPFWRTYFSKGLVQAPTSKTLHNWNENPLETKFWGPAPRP